MKSKHYKPSNIKIIKNYYKRTILTLEVLQNKGIKSIIPLLESPLGLAHRIIFQSINNAGKDLKSYKDELDSIKLMALGLSSAEKSAQIGDKLAKYALYQYAFHQFFQSSIRARQGLVLEKALAQALEDNKMISYKKNKHSEVLEKLDVKMSAKHDMDVFSSFEDKYLIVQIRSRDDTGGTTAKGSLVELIRDINQTRKHPNKPLNYFIYIWEPQAKQQRESLINKISDTLGLKPSEKATLSKGQALNYASNIDLRVVYGAPELFKALKQAFSLEIDIPKYTQFIEMLGQWDDLWLAYSLATLELENLLIRGFTNFEILDKLLKQEKVRIKGNHIINYRKYSLEIAQKILPSWKLDSIIFSSPADQLNYIRDLVLLKMVYLTITSGNFKNAIRSE